MPWLLLMVWGSFSSASVAAGDLTSSILNESQSTKKVQRKALHFSGKAVLLSNHKDHAIIL